MSKITVTDINLNVIPGTIIYIDIDIFRFTKDEDLFEVEIEVESNGEYKKLEIIDLNEIDEIVINHRDLERIALNWIFKSVDIIKEI